MISAVILVLREVIEAALLISLLLALTHALQLRHTWSLLAFIFGILGSALLANFSSDIANAFDGAGQELLNNLIYFMVILCVYGICTMVATRVLNVAQAVDGSRPIVGKELLPRPQRRLLYGLLIITVALAMAREGSEIYIYLTSFSGQADAMSSVLLGGAIGAGIGISLGAIAYYGFIFTSFRIFFPIFFAATALIIGGLAMQIVKELMQIGWLESQSPFWNSSWLIAETSLPGQLLYALIGYEAKPTPLQCLVYVLTISPIPALLIWQKYRQRVISHE